MKRNSRSQSLLVLLCMLAGPSYLSAQGHKGQNHHQNSAAETHAESIVFSPHDQQVIRDYFRVNTAGLPPGLAKRGGALPPGLERQLQRNGTLPPGLQKRLQPFPSELEKGLPRLPSGYARVVIGDRAAILNPANIIQDLMFIQ